MLDLARRKTPAPALAQWLLGLGIAAMLAANADNADNSDLLSKQAPRYSQMRVTGMAVRA